MSVLDHLTDEELAEFVEIQEKLHELDRYDWSQHARPEQLPPEGDWHVWLILAGRGWGKTRTGAEWISDQARRFPGTRWAVVSPTFADARDTCVEGESGLRAVLPPDEIAQWNRSLGELVLRNGSRIKLFSGDEPDRLRGPQHHGAWVDELAAFRYPEAWDQLQFGLRLGTSPRTVVTTTPRPTRLVRSLVERGGGDSLADRSSRGSNSDSTDDRDARGDGSESVGRVVITRGHTFDNAANLAPSALAELKARYEGTRLGRQELYAELLTDTPGALWTYDILEANRVSTAPELSRVVVAIDPAVTSGEDADLTGIIVSGIDRGTGRAFVLDDSSGRYSPDEWARRAVQLYERFDADRIVAEVNNGGELVERVLRTVDPSIPYRAVRASRGKQVRAEPVAALYEQGKVHHVGMFSELEEQLTTWTPDSGKSPDRLDALVWAITELMLERQKPKSHYRAA